MARAAWLQVVGGLGHGRYSQNVAHGRLERVARILEGLHPCFEDHAARCGDRVLGIAISEEDWDELDVAEIWGLPVLSWSEIAKGRVQLLCEANGNLIPPHDTVEDLLDHWNYRLQPASGP